MSAPRHPRVIHTSRGGFTLVELLVTLVVAVLLAAGAFTILGSQVALYTVQSAKLGTQVSLRTAANMLSWAIQEASATGGDLTTLGTNSVTMRAVHAGGIICSTSTQWLGVHDVSGQFAASDSVLIYSIQNDDWDIVTVAATDTTTSGLATRTPDCFWGDTTSAPNPEVAIDLAGSPAIIDSLLVGSAIRAFHPIQFGLEEVSGRYWLVQRVPSVVGPERLAGPLMSPADSGLVFSYYDADGDVTTTPSEVATVEILLKAESREDLSAYVRSGTLADTLRLRVSVRNN